MTTAWGGQPPNLNEATRTHWGADSIGIPGAVMKASWTAGEHAPSQLANDGLADALEYRWYIESQPAGGVVSGTELGDAELSVTADGTYTWTYRLVESGVLLSEVGTVTTLIGAAQPALTASVSGLAGAVATALGGITASINSPSTIAVSVAGTAAAVAQGTGAVSLTVGDLPVTPQPVAEPMVAWEVWEPFILPYADECPDSTMEFHVRRAAIEFSRFTRAWQADLNPVLADGASTVFSVSGPADSQVGVLLAVTVYRDGYQPQPLDVVTPDIGAQRMNDGDLRPCAFSDSGGSMVVWPAQPAGARIVARAVLRPAVMAANCPQFLFEQYASEIAAGALADILAMPSKPWTDLKTAAIHAAQFNARKSTVMLVVKRGNARSTRTTATRWF